MQEQIVFSGAPLGGGFMLAEIVNMLKSILSGRKGNTRPVDVQVGEMWIDDALDPMWMVKLWTGSVDLVLYNVNTISETATVPVIAGGTGADTPDGALTNLGLTAVGKSIARAADLAAIQTLLGRAAGAYRPMATQEQAELGSGSGLMDATLTGQAFAALAGGGGGGFLGVTEVTSTQDVTVPDGATAALVLLLGGGAGGANSYGSGGRYRAGGGGGPGAGLLGFATGLTAGTDITVTVGASKSGNQSGEATSFGAHLTAEGGTITANSYAAGAAGDVVEGTDGYLLMILHQEPATNGQNQVLNALGGTGGSLLTRGVGGLPHAFSAGYPATGYGSGGGGGSLNSYTARAGGASSPGYALIIWLG